LNVEDQRVAGRQTQVVAAIPSLFFLSFCPSSTSSIFQAVHTRASWRGSTLLLTVAPGSFRVFWSGRELSDGVTS